MALDESTENLEKLESNGVCAYVDPNLIKFLGNYGEINIDYVTPESGPSGFTIKVGNPDSCDPNACGSCGQ
ncbi:MAG: hypothetical protein KOO62_12540 [candidate division Zixibacteria bacterium]|nr:hypothetical protein [candidate division Zixibacteria bacterium]